MSDAKTPSISADYLVRGVIYALLEQCGRLLRDAKALYNDSSYGTAVAVAAFAREELGPSDILLELWEKVGAGETVTIGEIEQRCDNHLEKQRRAVRGITTMTNRDTGLGKLLEARFRADLLREERDGAHEQVKVVDKKQRQRASNERHELRLQGLYVGPDDLGRKWRLPKNMDEELADKFLTDATNDYAVALQIFEPDLQVVND